MEGGAVPTGLTPLVFGVGLAFLVLFLAFHLVFKWAMARWDTHWLALRRGKYGERFHDFVESYDQIAWRLSWLSRWLTAPLGVVLGAFVIYAGTVLALGLHTQSQRLLVLLVGLLWVMATPVLGLKLLSSSFKAGGAKIHAILGTDAGKI